MGPFQFTSVRVPGENPSVRQNRRAILDSEAAPIKDRRHEVPELELDEEENDHLMFIATLECGELGYPLSIGIPNLVPRCVPREDML